jgi:hypothetical protein
MSRFTVVTPELGGVGARVASAASELGVAQAALGRVAVAGGAADRPSVAAAAARLAEAWTPAVHAMQAGAETLGGRVAQAGQAYEQTDRTQMGGR